MTYQPPSGLRKPMSDEARAKISEALRIKAMQRRIEQGLPPEADGQNPPRSGETPWQMASRVYNPPPPKEPVKIELIQVKDLDYDPSIFETMKTGKLIDALFSTEGGLPRAINFIVVGDPGVGKSTVTLDILADLHRGGYKVLFISAEMTRIDIFKYVSRYPKFGEIQMLFLGEYDDSDPKDVVEQVINQGWDVVLIDSFAEVTDAVREISMMSAKSTEKWLIDIMVRNNLGNNDLKKYTTFLAIQQVNKSGSFVGSMKLKHNTTGMMEIRFEDPEEQIRPYVVFSKNRRGFVGKRIHYDLSKPEHVEYDHRKYKLSEESKALVDLEQDRINQESDNFDTMFGLTNSEDYED
jgi:predicted ATP-dependent serine protease